MDLKLRKCFAGNCIADLSSNGKVTSNLVHSSNAVFGYGRKQLTGYFFQFPESIKYFLQQLETKSVICVNNRLVLCLRLHVLLDRLDKGDPIAPK